MLSIVTVASSTSIPTASARPPRVMMLSVSPIAESAAIAPRIDGIDVVTIEVERQLTEEKQDHQAGERRGDHAFADHAIDRGTHEYRLIADRLDVECVRSRRGQR